MLEAERVARENWRIALTDPLTGLPNRRHLRCHLERAMAPGAQLALSLAIFDIDDFKGFNDRHGHVAGDEALVSVGRVLAQGMRRLERHNRARPAGNGPPGFTARLGGDEFVAVIPGKHPGQARIIARRLAGAIARHPALSPVGFTVSFGVASLDPTMHRCRELLAAADRDLYCGRSMRRNRPIPGRLSAPVPCPHAPGACAHRRASPASRNPMT